MNARIAGRLPPMMTTLAVLVRATATAPRADTLDQLYEKAKLEKALVFYSGGPAEPHERRASWYLAKEQQTRLGTFSSRFDVPPPPGFQPLASYKIANNYRELVTDEKLVADLRKRFEGHTGPAVNRGGVR